MDGLTARYGWQPTGRVCGQIRQSVLPASLPWALAGNIAAKSSRQVIGRRFQTTIRQRRINAKPTIGRVVLIQAGSMDKRTCAQCGRLLKPDQRGLFCGRRCIWRTWRQRSIASACEAQQLPLATLPPGSEEVLPAMGPERLLMATKLALLSRAPADARGYRVGIQHGHRQLMRWFPPARFRSPAMYMLDPFEWPAVPLQGTYAVVYLDGSCQPLGGPRFTIMVDQVDRRVFLMDGDRTFKPRPRS